MKKRIAAGALVVVLIALAAILWRATSGRKRDVLRVVETPSNSRERAVRYEVDFSKDVGGATLTAELWQDGNCAKGAPVVLDKGIDELRILLRVDYEAPDLNAQIDAGDEIGSATVRFDLPESLVGYAFSAYERGEELPVHPGEEKILAAITFDLGEGAEDVGASLLTEKPELLASAPCLFVVRAAFAAEPDQTSDPISS